MTKHRQPGVRQAKETTHERQTAKPDQLGPVAVRQRTDLGVLQRAVIDPGAASAEGILALQSAYGNRAVTGLLAGVSPRKEPTRHRARGTSYVQRYPADALQSGANIDWPAQTSAVKRSAEGVSGGVFFFKGKGGPIRELVVKPEYALEKESITPATGLFADKVLSSMGISVPDSRLVSDPGEENGIKATAAQKGAGIPNTLKKDGESHSFRFLRVMSKAQDPSLKAMLKGTTTIEGVQSWVDLFTQEGFLKKLGRLMLADALLGNWDRLGYGSCLHGFAFNLGNLIVSGGEITAIDSEALLPDVDLSKIGESDTGALNYQMLIDTLLDEADRVFNKVIALIAHCLEGSVTTQEGSDKNRTLGDTFTTIYAKEGPERNAGEKFKQGIRSGVDQVKAMLAQKGPTMQSLKQEARKQYKLAPKGKDLWQTFKTRAKYITARAGGASEAQALQQTAVYQFYRLVWSKQIPAQSKGLHPLIRDERFEYPKTKRGFMKRFEKGRAKANAMKLRRMAELQGMGAGTFNQTSSAKAESSINAYGGSLRNVKGKSDSAKKARFLIKTLILGYDLFLKRKEIAPKLQEARAVGGVPLDSTAPIFKEALKRAQVLKGLMLNWRTERGHYEAKFNSVCNVLAGLTKFDLNGFVQGLRFALKKVIESVDQFEDDLVNNAALLEAVQED
jgi:hypothetical protein